LTKEFIRVVFIGAGRVAQHYKKIIDMGLKGLSIVGVCDLKLEAAENLAKHWKCKAYSDYIVMIKELKPNLVIVLTPSGLHYEQCRIALEMGCNVLVEKPATMKPSESFELLKISDRNNLMLGVVFQNRLNPAIQSLRKALDAGRFGKIITATVRLRWCRFQDYYNDDWHGTWLNDGGVINQQAIHHVDALNWLVGPINSVCATTTNRLNNLEAEDTIVGCLRFENGALGTIEATTAARPQDFEASLSLVGEKGIVVIGGIALNKIEIWQFIEPVLEDNEVIIKNSQDVPTGYGLSHFELLQNTINALKENNIKAVPISLHDCIETTKVIHALYHSHEIGSWAFLKDNPLSLKLGIAE